MRHSVLVTFAALTVAAAGCSFSESSVSLSKSSGSIASSSSRDSEDRYRQDVADYTAAYVQSGGDFDAFERTLADLARRDGISDWEGNRATYVGIGEGLARAGVKDVALETWKANLSDGEQWKRDAIDAGYAHPKR